MEPQIFTPKTALPQEDTPLLAMYSLIELANNDCEREGVDLLSITVKDGPLGETLFSAYETLRLTVRSHDPRPAELAFRYSTFSRALKNYVRSKK